MSLTNLIQVREVAARLDLIIPKCQSQVYSLPYVWPSVERNRRTVIIGPDPARLKDLLDLPGEPPSVFRVFEPPAGTPVQRGVVPVGEFGGRGGVPEVYLPEGF